MEFLIAILGKLNRPVYFLGIGLVVILFAPPDLEWVGSIFLALWFVGTVDWCLKWFRSLEVDSKHELVERMESWDSEQHYYHVDEYHFSIKNLTRTPLVFSDLLINKLAQEKSYVFVLSPKNEVLFVHNLEALEKIRAPWVSIGEDILVPNHALIKPNEELLVKISNPGVEITQLAILKLNRRYLTNGIGDRLGRLLYPITGTVTVNLAL